MMNKRLRFLLCLVLISEFAVSSNFGSDLTYSDYNNEEFVLHDELYFDTTKVELDSEQEVLFNEQLLFVDSTTTENIEGLNKTLKLRRNKYRVVLNEYQKRFDYLYPLGSNYSQIFEDPKKKFDSKESRNVSRSMEIEELRNFSYHSFPGLAKMKKHLEALEKFSRGRAMVFPLKYHDVRWKVVKTNSGNEISSIRISGSKDLKGMAQNPIIVVVAGIHERERYAVQSAIFLATELIIDVSRGSRENFEWWIIPVLNPDKYEKSISGSKQKNLQESVETPKNEETNCPDINLDRNFEFQWIDCEKKDCDTNLSEEVPFSFLESRGLRDTLEAFSDFIDSFVALKEGKQMLVYPFADTLQCPRNSKRLENICSKAIKAFGKSVEGAFNCGQSSHLINLTAGFIEDWAKVHLGVEKSFAFYLGPTIKDRRDLASQHLMEHMNGTFNLLNVIARENITEKMSNRSSKISLSPTIIFLIIFSINHKYPIKMHEYIFR